MFHGGNDFIVKGSHSEMEILLASGQVPLQVVWAGWK